MHLQEPGISGSILGGLEIYIYKMHGEGALPTSTTYGVGERVVCGSMNHRFQSLDTQHGDLRKRYT